MGEEAALRPSCEKYFSWTYLFSLDPLAEATPVLEPQLEVVLLLWEALVRATCAS